MNHALSLARRLFAVAAFLLPMAAQAGPITYDAFLEGSGNTVYSVTGANSGSGAWTGTLADTPFPVPTLPLSLLSVVNFSFDALNNVLSGDFEFTSTDFSSTITGLLSGSFLSGDFDLGGQLSLDYDIRGGSGSFGGASGFLISFLDILPTGGGFGTYNEAATGQFTVAEPATLALCALALLGVLLPRAQRRAATRPWPGAV